MGYDIIIFLSNIHPYFKLPLYPLLKIPTFSTQKKKKNLPLHILLKNPSFHSRCFIQRKHFPSSNKHREKRGTKEVGEKESGL